MELEPIVILAKGKSGTTLLCSCLNAGGLFLGSNCNRTWDNLDVMGLAGWLSWQYRGNVWGIDQRGLKYRDLVLIRRLFYNMMSASSYHPLHIDFFGWKVDYSALLGIFMPLMFDSAKFIHLIRDGRDCCLSYLNRHPQRDTLYFINENPPVDLPRSFKPDTRENALYNAYGWANINNYILRLKKEGYGKWLTVKYEDLVRNPNATGTKIADFLPELDKKKFLGWMMEKAHASRVGKWKCNPRLILGKPLEIMTPMLKELGYHEGLV